MRVLKVDNYIISVPIIDILKRLKSVLTNGKLRDIRVNTDDIVVTCPNRNHSFGKENNPDCNIYIGDDERIPYGFARCFACEFKGQFVKFVQECFESSYEFARDWLIQNYGELAEETVLLDTEIELPTTKKSTYLDESILDQYQTWTPYLAKRKLSRDICEKFKVRYDSYNRQVIFPIRDMHGHLVMLAKRNIDTKFFHMDKDKEKEVYGLNVIQKNNVKSCIITEGPIDMLSSWSFGVPAIATLGTISDYQIEQINKSCLTTIYTMFDNDEAGQRFTEKLKKKLSKRIIVETINIPKPYKDLNDLSYELFKALYENAIKN